MPVGVRRVLVGVLAVLMGRRGVLLGFLVLAVAVVMGSLQVVMSCGVMPSCGLVMMFHCRVFLRHGATPLIGRVKSGEHC
jgi:hypothetical protein